MIVTRLNFPQMYSQVAEALHNSLFVAVDLEFTGLHLDPTLQNTHLDTSLHRYLKMRESISAFCPLQAGLCTFQLREGYVEAKPFSFVLYPVPVADLDRVYSFQSSSLAFLSSHEFDFNATFREGLGFLNRAEHTSVMRKAKEKEAQAYLQHGVTHEMRAYFAMCKAALSKWNGEEPLLVDARFMKRAVIDYTTRELERSGQVLCEVLRDKDGFQENLKVVKGKRPQPQQVLRGFAELVEHMKGKPLLGHNMLMDALHFYDKFINPLPPTLSYFARAFHEEFPVVLDTKYMLQASSVLRSFV